MTAANVGPVSASEPTFIEKRATSQSDPLRTITSPPTNAQN